MKKCFLIVSVLLIMMTTALFADDLSLLYRDGDHGNATDNHIKPHVKIKNNDMTSVNLSDITIRYYYSKEGTSTEVFNVDYAYIGGSTIIGTFHNDYLEIGFTPGAGSISGLGDSGEIQIRYNKADWSNYDETNDYSYNNSATTYSVTETITLYLNGVLVRGTEPGGATPLLCEPTPIPGEEPTPGDIPDDTGLAFVESGGLVVMEAEHFTGSVPGQADAAMTEWQEKTSYSYASNGAAMVTSPNRGINVGDTTNGPGLLYDVIISGTGTYYVWVRMWGPSLSDDSLHAGLDNVCATYGEKGMTINSYSWKWVNRAGDVVTVDITEPGLHTVNIWMREDGTRLDKILLTTDPDYVPDRKGPDESPRENPPTPEPTPEPTINEFPNAGLVWIQPAQKVVTAGEDFSLEIHLNSGNQNLAAYGFEVAFNPEILGINTSEGNNGVNPGPDGFVAAAGPDIPGNLRISGFDASGTGPGEDLHILNLNFTARAQGESDVTIAVEDLVDSDTNTIGNPTGQGGIVIVQEPASTPTGDTGMTPLTTTEPEQTPLTTATPGPEPGIINGDVNNDGRVDIIDALLCAQYFVGLNPANFNTGSGDVNSDGLISIVDALLIAQYYVGLIPEIPDPAEPTPQGDPTPIPEEGAGNVWLQPDSITVSPGSTFETSVHVNTGTQSLAGYGIIINYDNSLLSVTLGDIYEGDNGLITIINDSTPGVLVISGFDPGGIAPSVDAEILDITWTAARTTGTTEISVVVAELVDRDTVSIGIPAGIGTSVTIENAIENAGEVRMVPSHVTAIVGQNVETEIHVNTGTELLAAYGLTVTYNMNILTLWNYEEGADGFVSATSAHIPGEQAMSGFDVLGTGPGTDLHLLTLTWMAENTGTSMINLEINDLVNPNAETIGTPRGIGGTITVIEDPNSTGTPTPDPTEVPTPTPTPGPTEVPPPGAGDVFFVPDTLTVDEGELFTTEIHIDSGNQEVAAYGIFIHFDPDVVRVNTDLGKDGIIVGPDGYLAAVQVDPGEVRFAGFDTEGTGPGSDLHFLTVNWIGAAPGTTTLGMEVDSLIDGSYADVGTPAGRVGQVTVLPREELPGQMRIVPESTTAIVGQSAQTEIHVNTGNELFAAYGIAIIFDSSILALNNVEPGVDGFISAVGMGTPGSAMISGFDTSGTGPGNNLHLLTLTWVTLNTGTSLINLKVNDLINPAGETIGIPQGIGGTITVIEDSSSTGTPTPDPTEVPTPTPSPGPTEVPPPGAGDVSFVPATLTVDEGELFTTEIHIDSGNQKVAAYGIFIHFNPDVVLVNTQVGKNGIVEGPDGYLVSVQVDPGEVRFAGFDTEGTGPGSDLHFLTVNWIGAAPGTTTLGMEVDKLIDSSYVDVGTPAGRDGQVTVIATTPTPEPTATPEPTTVPETPEGAGDIWLTPSTLNVDVGDTFATEIHVNSGNQLIASYGFEITFDADVIEPDISMAQDGVEAGTDGFVSGANRDQWELLLINGIDFGVGPSADIHLCTIYWKALGPGVSPIDLTISTITDERYNPIGTPNETDAGVVVSGIVEGAGTVRLVTPGSTLPIGSTCDVEIHLNSGNQVVAAYQFDLYYDETILGATEDSVEPGPDGFVATVNALTPGVLIFNGFDVIGMGPGSDLHFVNVYFSCNGEGRSPLTLEIESLVDADYNTVGIPAGIGSSVTVVSPAGVPGQMRVVPESTTAIVGQSVQTEIHVNTGNELLAAYGIEIIFDSSILALNNVEPGGDGFISAAGMNTPGSVMISGFDASGIGPGNNLHLLTLTWIGINTGTSMINLEIDQLINSNVETLGIPQGIGGTITVIEDPGSTSTPIPDPTEVPTPTPSPGPTEVPPPGAGNVFLVPDILTVDEGELFTTEIHIDSGNQKVGAYGIFIHFNPDVVQVNTDLGNDGIIEGPDGYLAAVQVDPGELRFAGFDTEGTGPGNDLHFLTVNWIGAAPGTTTLIMEVNSLVTERGAVVGTPVGRDGQVTVVATTPTPEPTATPEPTTVPETPEGAGDIWFTPSTLTVDPGDTFTTEIHVNSGNQLIATYGFAITFDADVIEPDISMGRNSVEAGADGFVTGANRDERELLLINGIDTGVGPSVDIHLCTIYWKALGPGASPIDLTIGNLTDEDTNTIGTPDETDASVVVNGIVEGAGTIWFVPENQSVVIGQDFTTDIRLNSGDFTFAAYGLDIAYDTTIIEVDTGKGTLGVDPGPDGFIAAVGFEDDLLRISGFDVSGTEPGDDLHILTVYWSALAAGSTDLVINIRDLIDLSYNTIGTPNGETGSVTVLGM